MIHQPPDDDFIRALVLAEALVGKVSRDHLEAASKVMAINLGYYLTIYGEAPRELLQGLTAGETLNEQAKAYVTAGMYELVAALGEVAGFDPEDGHPVTHH